MRSVVGWVVAMALAGCAGAPVEFSAEPAPDAEQNDAALAAKVEVVPGFSQSLLSCGLLTEGRLPRHLEEWTDGFVGAEHTCMMACIHDAACSELSDLYCNDTLSASLLACGKECMRRHGHACESGDFIPQSWVCNGKPDCPDAGDEFGCPVGTGLFVCANFAGAVPYD